MPGQEWGEFLVGDGFSEIVFNVDGRCSRHLRHGRADVCSAYDHLVLEPATKELVRALVDQSQAKKDDGIQDVIAGKGGGLICVLHGRPGTGKVRSCSNRPL